MRFCGSSIWIFRWVSCGSVNLLLGFMKRNAFFIFHLDDFLFDLPFRAISCVRWMIAIAICTFCFIFAFMIVMSSLYTFRIFWFVLAASFVVAIFLTIKATLWIWNVNFCATNQETNFDLRGYVWTIYGQYVGIWRNQLPIFSPLHAFNFGNTLWLQFIFDVLFIHISQLFTSNHTSWRIECALWGVTLIGMSINLSALKRLSLWALFSKCTNSCLP